MSIPNENNDMNDPQEYGAVPPGDEGTGQNMGPNNTQLSGPNETGGSMSTKEVNDWSMYLHLSQLASSVVPVAGLVIPIVLWQMKKDESEVIDRHGKIVLNWLISSLIYVTASAALILLAIGIVLLPVVVVLTIIFPIMGAIKAGKGEIWHYPMSINFMSVDK